MEDLIKELEDRVAAKRKELEDEEHALATVRRMMGQSPSIASPVAAHKDVLGLINFEDLIGSVEKTKKRTLIDDVRDVVSQFAQHEFTVVHIEAALKRIGVVIDAKSPRARISMALGKLVEDGTVIKVAEGGGNVPHRYKLKEDGSDLV
ncbi:MAG TPA: hypothetical protein VMV97_09660 [Sulfuriferula sp.]|nr:hypothetical protein [Sulfuriferula sp.]